MRLVTYRVVHCWKCAILEITYSPSLSFSLSVFPIYVIVSDQNGVSSLYIMVEIYHSGQKPSISTSTSVYISI